MLDKIREMAMEKLASEEAVEAFMEGFGKEVQASLFGGGTMSGYATRFANNQDVQRAAVGIGASLLGAAVVKGFSSGSKSVGTYQMRQKFETALAQVMSSNKLAKGAKPERIKSYAETMFKFAPNVSSDPNMLAYLLSAAADVESLDINTMKMLVDLESRYTESHKTNPIPGIRA